MTSPGNAPSPMPDESEFAHRLASSVLARMRVDGGPPWTVLSARVDEEVSEPRTDPSGVFHIRVTVGTGTSSEAVAIYFTAGVPLADAIVATASQLQDHAIEATCGAALPACPGHAHPLSPRVLGGAVHWVCPAEATHHREPVL